MSNPILLMSLAGISGGLGRASTREVTGVVKERAHIKNLAPWEQSAARDEYKALVEKAKADRAAAIAEWYSRYPGAMPVEYRKIDKVVADFLVGKVASAPASGVDTDGSVLTVAGKAVASRRSANDRFIQVCPGQFGEGKGARYAANSVLRHVGAGIRVSDISRGKGDAGYAFFAPSRSPSQGRIVTPDACLQVEVTKKIRESALKTAYGDETARYASRESVEPRASAPRAPSNPKHARDYGRKKGQRNPLKQIEENHKKMLMDRGMSAGKASAEAKKYVAAKVAQLKAKSKSAGKKK